jgi:molybdopterin molybdotransferase
MVTYPEALERILKNIHTLEAEERPLFQSMGHVLAEDIYSDLNLPLLDQAGPDGYAVMSGDIKNASKEQPAMLKISGTVRAGLLPPKRVIPGTAMRIMTGSVVPDGADCVVWFEDTDEPGNKSGPNKDNPSMVKIYKSEKPGANITKSGATVKKGALVLSRGALIGAAQISALTTIGKKAVKIFRRPMIAIISTGDELINLGETLVPGKAYNCNAPAVAALVAHYGGVPRILGIARDNEKSLLIKIGKGLAFDAVITSAGASKGDYDLVRNVIAKMGELVFSRINMGPGASMAFAMLDKDGQNGQTAPVPMFAIAGPPEGCLINFETLVRPALFKMLGIEKLEHPVVEAVAQDSAPGKRSNSFVRWSKLEKIAGGYQVEIGLKEQVGALSALANANCLTIVPGGSEVDAGDKIQVLPLDWQANSISI